MKNVSISIARVSAMFLIIFCHYSSWIGLEWLASVFNVGVQIFFLISGYLYSNKEIYNPATFLWKRWIKVCLPALILSAILSVFETIAKSDAKYLVYFVQYLFNIQGIGTFYDKWYIQFVYGTAHLWFLTAIMTNYIFLIILNKYKKHWNEKKKCMEVLGILIIADISLSFIHIHLVNFIPFFIGYVYGIQKVRYTHKKYIALTCATLFALLARVVCQHLIDGTNVYLYGIVPYGQIIFAGWIIDTVVLLSKKLMVIAESKAFRWIEEHSMFIYITHYMFLTEPFNVNRIGCNTLIQTICFAVFTITTAVILKMISNRTFHVLS